MSNPQDQHSPKIVQVNGTADPYAGGYSTTSMRPKQGHAFNRATAFVLADSHQDYVVHSRLRNVLRALIVFGVFAAVITLIAVKYATDDSLRGSTVTVREDNVGDLSQTRIELANCPCHNETLFWSSFTTFRAPLSLDVDKQAEFCRQSIVPELATATVPTANSSIEDIRAYTGYLTTLQENVATVIACSLAVQDIVKALDPNPDAHTIGIGDNLASDELLSQQQIRHQLDALIGSKVLLYNQDFASQLVLQRLVLTQQQSNLTNLIAKANATGVLNDTSAANAVEAAALSFDLYANITNDALNSLLNTASDKPYVNRLLNALKAATTIDYAAYQGDCKAFYCDYITTKSTWSRVTEFLGLLGGLYTTCLGLGFTAWFLVDVILPDGHGKFML